MSCLGAFGVWVVALFGLPSLFGAKLLAAVVLGRGGFPPEFDLVATHPTPHMFAVQIVATSGAHFSISIHCF
jgi:hypothetical protein